MRNTTARALAKQQGEKTYVTGTPCKNGHNSPRATHSGTCLACTAAAIKQWAVANREKVNAYVAAYRERNRDAVRVRDRQAHKVARMADPERFAKVRAAWYAEQVAAQGRIVRPFNRLPEHDVAAQVLQVHSGLLEYVRGYTTMLTNAVFLCTQHAVEVSAHPHNVVRGANPCPQCNHMKSKEEARIAEYLSMFTHVVQRDRTTIKPKELDILLPEKKLAIEYCGEYWHSHFDAETNRRDKHKHFDKYTACAAQGIRLLTIFESEWKEREPALRRLLRNALGKGRGKLMARKCTLQKVPTTEAKAFYEKYHPQGGAGGGEHYGLYWKGKLVACMRFALGQNDRGAGAKTRTWTLGRYATRVTVAGAASRLFKAFVQDYSPTEVKSFSDNRYFSGGMYEQLGFALEEEVSPDYQVWSPKIGLLPKSHYQRRMLQKRLDEHGVKDTFDAATDPRTEAEMTYLMGCGKIYDCGKKRWVWTAQNVI